MDNFKFFKKLEQQQFKMFLHQNAMDQGGFPLRPSISKALHRPQVFPFSPLPAKRGEIGFNSEPALAWVALTRIYCKRLTQRAENMGSLSLNSPFLQQHLSWRIYHDLLVPSPPARSILNGIADSTQPPPNIQGFIFMVCQLPPATPCPHPHSGALDGPLPEVGLFIPSSSNKPRPCLPDEPISFLEAMPTSWRRLAHWGNCSDADRDVAVCQPCSDCTHTSRNWNPAYVPWGWPSKALGGIKHQLWLRPGLRKSPFWFYKWNMWHGARTCAWGPRDRGSNPKPSSRWPWTVDCFPIIWASV